jgi:acyl-CoA reductase-like NAD-dependent aldehyde dehydrogenase
MPLDRILQEIHSAHCQRDAEDIIDAAKDELDALPAHVREQWLERMADAYCELKE